MRVRGFEVVSTYDKEDINLPLCATKRAAGYDFFAAHDVVVPSLWRHIFKALFIDKKEHHRPTFDPNVMQRVEEVVLRVKELGYLDLPSTEVRTGIKAYMAADEVLMIHNRSSNPVKRFLILAEGVGVVDADYYNSEQEEGEIKFHFWNFGFFDRKIKKGERIGQGVFQKFLKADSGYAQESDAFRKGGHGSTLN